MTSAQPNELLTEREVATLLKLNRQTLSNWRCDGRGPRFVKIGDRSIRYWRSEVEAWIGGRPTP